MSRSITDARLAFHATHDDVASATTKEFLVLFFHGDRTIELIDAKSTKTFLKRSPAPQLSQAQFFIGANVVVFGRVLHITSYADKVTEQLCERLSESTVVVLGEANFPRVGEALDVLTQECRFGVSDMQVLRVGKFDKDGPYADAIARLPPQWASGREAALLIHVIRDHAVAKSQELPGRIGDKKSVWVAADRGEADAVAGLFALARGRPTAVIDGTPSSTVVVKPDTLGAQRGGSVLQTIIDQAAAQGNPLTLVALSQMSLSSLAADQFLNAYKGILPDYRATVENLASGAVWAAQFVGGEDPVGVVRGICGPYDPVIAKRLRPKSLRGKMGTDGVRNVVHCSDLPEDGCVDAEYLWSTRRHT